MIKNVFTRSDENGLTDLPVCTVVSIPGTKTSHDVALIAGIKWSVNVPSRKAQSRGKPGKNRREIGSGKGGRCFLCFVSLKSRERFHVTLSLFSSPPRLSLPLSPSPLTFLLTPVSLPFTLCHASLPPPPQFLQVRKWALE